MIVDRAPQSTRCTFCGNGISGISPDVKVCAEMYVLCFGCARRELPHAFARGIGGRQTQEQAACDHNYGRIVVTAYAGTTMSCRRCGKVTPPRVGVR